MIIGGVLSPRQWERWPEAEAMLEPARKLGDRETVLRDDEALWVVMDGDDLLACATARITEHGCEVILIGGRDHRRWVGELDRVIGSAAARAGAARMVAMGRRGWLKSLLQLGWAKHSEDADGICIYTRELRD